MIFKIAAPKNIFTQLLFSSFNSSELQVSYLPNAMLQKGLADGSFDIVLIPGLELVNENNLFISNKVGIAFDGIISPDYIYYTHDSQVESFQLYGDISMNEIVLSKILFRENFGKEINQTIVTKIKANEDLILAGDLNFINDKYLKGDSFSEQMAYYLEAPYLKYVFASKNKQGIEFINSFKPQLEERIKKNIDEILNRNNFSSELIENFHKEFNSVYFELSPIEVEAFDEFRKIPYYYKLTDELMEIAFV